MNQVSVGVTLLTLLESRLCDNIVCKNAGVCAIRNTNGPYVSVCLCRFATSGDYCELNGNASMVV